MQHSSLSRSLLESGVHSVIPTRTSGVLTTIASIRSAKASGTLMAPIPSARLRDKTMPATEGHRRLTSKELMVFALLKRGDANKIIAHELSMSENTVKIHVRNIIRKMQATNRTQAVDKARMLWDSID